MKNKLFSNSGTHEGDNKQTISSTNIGISGSLETRPSIDGGGESGVGMFFFILGFIILSVGIVAIFYFRKIDG